MTDPDVPPLRDFFAALAMQSLLGQTPMPYSTYRSLQQVSSLAYAMADEMMKARDQG